MCMADRTAPSWGQSLQILSMMATHGESTAKNIFKTHLITQGICACIIVRNLYIMHNILVDAKAGDEADRDYLRSLSTKN